MANSGAAPQKVRCSLVTRAGRATPGTGPRQTDTCAQESRTRLSQRHHSHGPKCGNNQAPVGRGTEKQECVFHTAEYYSAVKKEGRRTQVSALWTTLKAVRPVEKAGVNGHGQTEGSRSHEVSGTGEAAQTESQLLSARGWGRG